MEDAVAPTEHLSIGGEVRASALSSAVLCDVPQDEALLAQWDVLACTSGSPRSAPAWVMAWYRFVLADPTRIRVVVVHRGERLVGVLPLYVSRDRWGFARYRMAGHQTIVGVEPLVDRDAGPGATEELGRRLRSLRPVPDTVELECVQRGRSLLEDATRSWRPRPALTSSDSVAPRLALSDGAYARWLDLRSRANVKQERRLRRRLLDAGFEQRVITDPEGIVARLPALQRLYDERKASRGGWGLTFDTGVVNMLNDAVQRLSSEGRLVLVALESPSEIIAADLATSAGGTMSAWIGAFSEQMSSYSPGRLNLFALLEWASRHEIAELDWGPGDEPYKEALSSHQVPVQAVTLTRRGAWPLNTPAALIPGPARTTLSRARAAAAALRGRRHE